MPHRPTSLLLFLALFLAPHPPAAWGQAGDPKVEKIGRQARDSVAQDLKDAAKEDSDPDNDAELYTLPRKIALGRRPAIDPRNIPGTAFGDRLNLTSSWLFNSGSEPSFSSPQLDDSGWTVVDTTRPLFFAGFFNLNEVWYRQHVHLVPGTRDLALTVADFGGSYRVYANGQELGGHGRMSRRGDFLFARSATYPIPPGAIAGPDLVIAIHAFVGTIDRVSFTLGDGIHEGSAVYLGSANTLWRDQQVYFADGLRESSGILTLWAVLLSLAIALSFLIPRVQAYPLLAVYAGGHLLGVLLTDYADFHYLPHTHWLIWPINLFLISSQLAALEFCRTAAGIPRKRWFTAFEAFYLLANASLLPAALGVFSYTIFAGLDRFSYYLLLTVIFLMLALGLRRRRPDANVLAAAAGLYLFYLALWKSLHYIVFGFDVLNRLSDTFIDKLQPSPMGNLAIVAGFLTVIVVRTLHIVRERASIANEIEAARTMQQLLLARSNQPTPGFIVESVYLPAGEVGGDFFLISPCLDSAEDASLTVIVGDVSGKGLRAAMRVSMILGVLRREPSREPAAMLAGLNQALTDQGDTGFTTACCLRLAPDGRYSVANAGHISPYLAGRELTTAPALPLGLAPDQVYELLEGRLLPGQRLVLMSDGVAEARNARGELYGFDRLAPLTMRPAAEIARTAQAFGQDDDITVLTIGCTPRTTNAAPPPPVAAPLPPRAI